MSAIDDLPIPRERAQGTTVGRLLAEIASHCASVEENEAHALFAHVLVRFQLARDELAAAQGDYTKTHDQRSTTLFTNELVKFHGLVLAFVEASLAGRVVQHKKLVKRLEEVHAGALGAHNNREGGLDRVFCQVRGVKKLDHDADWKDQFETLTAEFEKKLAAKVDDAATWTKFTQNELLTVEAATLLHDAEKNRDRLQWSGNELAKRMAERIKNVKYSADAEVPEWFLPESEIVKQGRFAKGSYGAVYHGVWGLGTKVVIKVLLLDGTDRLGRTAQQQFIEEANLWSKMSHPYVIRLYGACHVTAPPFFVCEDATGGDLYNFLARTTAKRWRHLFQTALALEYLHGKNVIHGDLKLNNVLVGADGYARLCDFGLSRFKKQSRDRMLTRQDSSMQGSGALRWSAPECVGAGKVKPQFKSDIYSFGMCLIEAFSGEAPYIEFSDNAAELMIKNGDLPHKPESMPDDIWTLVQRMTAKNPDDRVDLKEVIKELQILANAELQAEVDATKVCQNCNTPLPSDSNKCNKCDRQVASKKMQVEVGVITSAADLPRIVELLTLSDAHKKASSIALRDYLFGKPDRQREVKKAGAIPILTKMLTEGGEPEIQLEVLLALGCAVVGNGKVQETAVFEGVLGLLKSKLQSEDDKMKAKAVLMLGYMAHGNPGIREAVHGDSELLELVNHLKLNGTIDQKANADRAMMFLNPKTAKAG